MFNRREWLRGLGIMAGVATQWSGVSIAEEKAEPPLRHQSLELSQFAPKSMLQVHESQRSALQVSAHRFSHPHQQLGQIGARSVARICTNVFVHTQRASGSHGSEEHSRHGEPDRRIRRWIERCDCQIRSRVSGALLLFYRALLRALQRAELSQDPGGPDRAGSPTRSARAQDLKDAGSLPAREHHLGTTGED